MAGWEQVFKGTVMRDVMKLAMHVADNTTCPATAGELKQFMNCLPSRSDDRAVELFESYFLISRLYSRRQVWMKRLDDGVAKWSFRKVNQNR